MGLFDALPAITPGLLKQRAAAMAIPAPTLTPIDMSGGGNGNVSLPRVAMQGVRLPTQAETDTTKLNSLVNSGSGISQINNPLLRGLARTADIVGSVFGPTRALEAAIPGTELHHQVLVHQARETVANDQQQQLANAKLFSDQAGTENTQASTRLTNDKAAEAEAPAGPQGDPTKTVTTDAGIMQFNPATQKYDQKIGDAVDKQHQTIEEKAYDYAIAQGKSPTEAIGAIYGAKDQHVATLPQQYLDAIAAGDMTRANLIRKANETMSVQPKIEVHNAEARPEAGGTWTTGFDGDKNPVMFNSKTGEIKPMNGSFSKNTAANAKIGSDEQKRADLAQNIYENLDALDDIATRRPELFGPVAGRLTDLKVATGTSDPDIAKLEVLKHNLGMVQQGVHGMRSAQGVEASAAALVNGYHNSPAALKAATQAARESARTFSADSENPGKPRPAESTTTFKDNGTTYHIPADQIAEFKKDHPNAR